MMAFNAAIIVLLAVSGYGESAATSAGPPSSSNPSQLFDPTRGVLLQGAQGQEVAEMCGASPKSKSWEVTSSEIESIEQQLAPLLAGDLRNTGSKELPRQYYDNTLPVAYENSMRFLSMDSTKITSRQLPINRVGSMALLAFLTAETSIGAPSTSKSSKNS
jgi:hypothetical protein